QGGTFNINPCIDALPILATVACFARGKTTILGARAAKNKESDRLFCMQQELAKMGGKLVEIEDGLEVNYSPLCGGGVVQSHSDHRIAMSLTCGALGAQEKTTIFGMEWVKKTYPDFITDFQKLGASIV
ncbi:MAG: 3-phosphoshikimate 1-carboxyvinyltransferase, partial [Proteobacteria bacterium]|nr:3-phosphoshikimate 1-carboxyvinyltransferase [Pseudomonadota bacterium]